jgi:hypothetical protein
MEASRPAHPTSGYLPARVPMTGTVGHSSRKVVIATLEAPNRICGQALGVGYTGPLQTDLAIYRLQVKSNPDLPASTLTDLFVLEHSIFRAYE